MCDVDPQRARDMRAGIPKAVRASGVQLDGITGSRDMDAIRHRHLELTLENEAELVTLVVKRSGGARGPGLVPVFGQLVSPLGIVEDHPSLHSLRASDHLLVFGAVDDRLLVPGLDGVA